MITGAIHNSSDPAGHPHKNGVLHLELLMRSERARNQLLERLGKLHDYLNADGRLILSSIVKQFKRELGDEAGLLSEREFDFQHRTLYAFLAQTSVKITKNEMRLCALLAQGNSPSEIARLLYRSTNCINVAFARIRAKLGILSNHDLRSFLVGFNEANSLRA